MKSIILPIKKGETLTYSNTKSTSFQRYIVTKELPVANLVILANQINSFTGNTVSITNELDKDGYLILCTYRSTVTDYSETEFFKEVQIERGKEATKYEPYTSTTTNIYLNEPLRKVGDAVDYIDFKNKKVVRNVGTMEHTTNTTATRGKNATESGVYRNYIIPSSLMKVGTNIDGLCTTLATNKKEWASLIAPSVRFGQANSVIYIMTPKQMATNQDLYNYVTNNGKNKCIYYYQLSNFTEEKVDIPDISLASGTKGITIGTSITPSKIEAIYSKEK